MFVDERLKQFRLIPLKVRDKAPLWTGWTNRGLKWDDPFLEQHLSSGGNYGVLTGHGLTVLDVDPEGVEAGVLDSVERNLVETFTVRTPRNGRHFYYFCDSPKILLKDKCGDVQVLGRQVVGPGCVVSAELHPKTVKKSGRYIVENNIPIHQVSGDELVSALRQWIRVEPSNNVVVKHQSVSSNLERPSMRCEISLTGFHKSCTNSSWFVGVSPVHGSKTGRNLSVNVDSGMWRCWHCRGGGDVFQWIAVREGWIRCGDKLDHDTFLRVVRLWRKTR